jgi:hypothetical protein
MTFFVGHSGVVRLRRRSLEEVDLPITVDTSEINTTLNRLYFNGSEDNIITGDQLFISTDDSRGLAFFAPTAWATSLQVQKYLRVYVNVNALGGLRFYDQFADAINNNRENELTLAANFGAPIIASIIIRDSRYNTLGSVISYDINTDRAAVETTSLSDKFRQQYSAGLISGNGSIECLFSYQTVEDEETPLFLLQTIQRLDVGSELSMLLSLSPPEGERSDFSASSNEVFYEVQAVITRAGVTVRSDALISCSIDFLTTGEFKVKVGIPNEYILKEDFDLIEMEENQETGLGFLLQEITD